MSFFILSLEKYLVLTSGHIFCLNNSFCSYCISSKNAVITITCFWPFRLNHVINSILHVPVEKFAL